MRTLAFAVSMIVLPLCILFAAGRMDSTNAAAFGPARPDSPAPSAIVRVRSQNILGATAICDGGNNVDVESTSGSDLLEGYATLGAAFNAINAGTHTGTIVVEICSNTTEGTSPATLNSSGAGSASYGSISIYPIADGIVISGNPPSGLGLIQLNGADSVTIDGDNPNSPGTNRNLTFQNTATNISTFGQVIRIALATSVVTNSDNVTIKNLTVIGHATGMNIASVTGTATSGNASYGILATSGASTVNPTIAPAAINAVSTTIGGVATANNLRIQNNNIGNVARAIAIQGSATTVFPSLLIDGNAIGNSTAGAVDQVYSIGITVQGATNPIIRSNTIYVESFLITALRGIDIGTLNVAVSGAIIDKNMVGRVRNNRPQSSGAYGINLGNGNNHRVQNNFVVDV